MTFFSFFIKGFIYLFLDRGEGREKHHCVVASCTPPTGDPACNPGMCPDWELNRQPFGSQAHISQVRYDFHLLLTEISNECNNTDKLMQIESSDWQPFVWVHHCLFFPISVPHGVFLDIFLPNHLPWNVNTTDILHMFYILYTSLSLCVYILQIYYIKRVRSLHPLHKNQYLSPLRMHTQYLHWVKLDK